MSEPDPYGAILRAARWAETEDTFSPLYPASATVLYDVAGKVAAGQLDVSDMPEINATWSGVTAYLSTKGIDVIAIAARSLGAGRRFA